MPIRVIGAGHSRTGTSSLKKALVLVLESPCYHMHDVFMNPDHIPVWRTAIRGEVVDWAELFSGYSAAVDWPAALFWPEISAAFPDAIVVLSLRDAEAWWRSARETVFSVIEGVDEKGDLSEWKAMMTELIRSRFTPDLFDRDACIAAFERHSEIVRREVPKDRLVVWEAGEGWEPICSALQVPVPKTPYPVINTREQFLARNAKTS